MYTNFLTRCKNLIKNFMETEYLLNCKTVEDAVTFIFAHTGNEQNFMDIILYGVGVYAYTSDVQKLKMFIEPSKNSVFTHINEEQCKLLLESLNIFNKQI